VIGHLRGVIVAKHPPALTVDVNGIGYELDAPMSTFYELPELGIEVLLHTHLVVREDAQQLFGFISTRERQLFRGLIRVNGVGARLALSILSGISVDGFSRCVMESDVAALTRIPGIGKKTAERLLVEMRDRIAAGEIGGDAASGPVNAKDEAQAALVALGYKPAEATRMLGKVDEGATSEALIRQALQSVVKGA
jgi:holliday junction DNA helicase RuvA